MSAACPHRPPCLACPRFGEPGLAAASRLALEALASTHGLTHGVIRIEGPLRGFRHRARLAIRGRLNSPKIGLFEVDSHRVVHIPRCSIQHPLINHAASIVRRALVDTRTTCYSDAAHLGLARYLQVVVERASQTAQIVLVANAPDAAPLAECLDLIRERMDRDLHSLWFNANIERGNAILGPQFERWYGPPTVVEHFGGAAIHYPPGAFGQSNLLVAERIIQQLRRELPSEIALAEFYAGVGAIGLSLIDRASRLSLNEISPHSLAGLESGITQLDAVQRAKVSIFPGGASQALDASAGVDVIVADPPRKGLDPELCARLVERAPPAFYYISCGVQSLIRDTAQLTGGKLRLTGLTAYNLFPFTDHVETVARFERT